PPPGQASPAETPQAGQPAAATYPGVRPGTGHLPPVPPSAQERARTDIVTWPGFEASVDGGSRFFLQLTGPVQIATTSTKGTLAIVLRDTTVHLRTNYLPLVTKYFNTPVSRAYLQRRGSATAFVLELRADVRPKITQSRGADGYQYLFVDFPAGDYAPAQDAAPAPLQSRTVSTPDEPDTDLY
ncbi:MAG: hypothetical protein KC543_13155, partial [Myxococcales bacterium]|nr:hypothetical protein [Myxococcales bacterium]